MEEKIHLSHEVAEEITPIRLDQYLAQIYPDYSRSKWQEWIKAGFIFLNGKCIKKPNHTVQTFDKIECQVAVEPNVGWRAQPLPLNIVYEDDSLMVVNKPSDCVVHPAAGHQENTLVNALLHHYPRLEALPRGGIIHRLDKDTTGLMVVPKSLKAHTLLVDALQKRHIERLYRALVYGEIISGGTIDQPMGRHPKNRLKMAVLPSGKHATTHYRVREKFNGFTEVDLKLETGRTHQIRVHLNYIGFPIIGDPLYGKRNQLPKGLDDELRLAVENFPRQALHATKLSFEHPQTQKWMSFDSDPPEDYASLLELLQSNCR